MKYTGNKLGFYIDPSHPELEAHLDWLSEREISCIGAPSHDSLENGLVRRLENLMEKYGMRMASLHGAPFLLSPDGNDFGLKPAYHGLFERVRRWNAEAIILHFRSVQHPWRVGVWWQDTDYIQGIGVEECDRRQGRMLEWICGEAAKSGTSVALENVPQFFPYSYDAREIASVVRSYGIPNLGVCFDSGHAHLGDLDVSLVAGELGSTLITTHLHDNFGWKGPLSSIPEVDLHLVPGIGTIDWRVLLRAFRSIDYSGPFIFEDPNLPGVFDVRKVWELTLANWEIFEVLAARKA